MNCQLLTHDTDTGFLSDGLSKWVHMLSNFFHYKVRSSLLIRLSTNAITKFEWQCPQ